jgi:hypothetical protein
MIAAAIVAQGGTASALTMGRAQLLAALHNIIADDDVSHLTSSEGQILAAIFNTMSDDPDLSARSSSLGGLLAAIASTSAAASALTSSTGKLWELAMNAVGAFTPVDGGGGGDVPAWVTALAAPSGDLPLAASQPGSAHYWANGAEVAANVFFATVDKIVPSSGIVLGPADLPVALTGAALTAFLASSGTILIQANTDADPSSVYPLIINTSDDGQEALYVQWFPETIAVGGYTDDADWEIGGAGTTDHTINQSVKLAINLSPTTQAICSTGGTLVTNATDIAPAPEQVLIGHYDAAHVVGQNITLSLIAIYATQPEADLDNMVA